MATADAAAAGAAAASAAVEAASSEGAIVEPAAASPALAVPPSPVPSVLLSRRTRKKIASPVLHGLHKLLGLCESVPSLSFGGFCRLWTAHELWTAHAPCELDDRLEYERGQTYDRE